MWNSFTTALDAPVKLGHLVVAVIIIAVGVIGAERKIREQLDAIGSIVARICRRVDPPDAG